MMMPGGLMLGRYRRTQVFVDWSWLFIVVLLTWSLTDTFGAWHPAWSLARRIVVASMASALFFASVLAHELAHVAIRDAAGEDHRRVTLWMFGGVTATQREPRSLRDEVRASLAGPLTSLTLGGIFLALGALGVARMDRLISDPREVFAALGPTSTLLLWLGPMNIALGLFNLLPAFPLDGGRLLRAGFWAMTGDLRRATLWAGGVGRVVAWAFILQGVAMLFGAGLPALGGGPLAGSWFVFVGWFLHSAAVRSTRLARAEDILGDVAVSRLMRRTGPFVTPDLTVERLVNEWLLPTADRVWPVLDGTLFRGLVCLADVRKVPRAQWADTQVAQICTPSHELVFAGPDERVSDVLTALSWRDVAQLPVVANGQLVGMLVLRDVLRWIELRPAEGAPPWAAPAAPPPPSPMPPADALPAT